MNEELQERLKKELGINSSNSKEENRSIILGKLHDIQKLQNQVNNLLVLNGKDFFDEWGVALRKDYNAADIINNFDVEKNLRQIGIKSVFMGSKYLILLEYNVLKGEIYCGLGRHFCSSTKLEEIKNLTSKLELDDFVSDDDEWWYGWKYSAELSEGFNDLKALMGVIKEED
jgi:hypothetical protein